MRARAHAYNGDDDDEEEEEEDGGSGGCDDDDDNYHDEGPLLLGVRRQHDQGWLCDKYRRLHLLLAAVESKIVMGVVMGQTSCFVGLSKGRLCARCCVVGSSWPRSGWRG